MKPSLDIVIVNWNSGPQLRACLESIAAAELSALDLQRVVVVDNASQDGSADGMAIPALPLNVLRNANNRGFGAACNQGAATSDSDFILFLNPDARVFADTMGSAVRFMQGRGAAGICGVALEDDDRHIHRSCCRLPKAREFLVKALGLDRLSHGVLRSYAMAEWSHDDTRQVDHVIGAFYLVRRAVYRELRGFDERFFVYLEDLDFSARARAAGSECWFLSSVRAYHRGGGTSNRIKATRLFYSLRSRLQYASKHLTRAGFGLLAIATLSIEPFVRISGAAVKGAWHQIPDTLEAYVHLWKWVLTKR